MSKHEARTSLLSDSSMAGVSSYASPLPPNAHHSPNSSRHDYKTSNGYSRNLYSPDPYPTRTYADAAPVQPTPGGYAQREGFIAGTQTSSKRSSLRYFPTSKWQWAFVSVVFGQAIIGLALECYIFGKFQSSLNTTVKDPNARTVPTYLSLFIFGFVYQLFLVYDALRMKNTIQVIGLCIYNVGLLIEASVQSDQIHDAVNFLLIEHDAINGDFWAHIQPYIIAVPCVIALGLVLMCLTTWKLYHEFAWSIYKDISADLRLKRRFLSYQIYIALLKFDFFFFLVFSVQFLVVVVETSDFEFYLTIAAIPITIILLFLAAYWAKRETVAGMVCIIAVYFAALAYFIFKLIRMYSGPVNRVQDYKPARRSLTTFAIITLLLLLVTIVYALICTANFNKGLKPHISGKATRHRAASVEMDKLYEHGEAQIVGGPNRITID